MKGIFLAAALMLLLSNPAWAREAGPVPAQLPDQSFRTDPLLNMEREQVMQETLQILREMASVMKEAEALRPEQRRRLEAVSERLDFLIMRQQELAMRQRFGRP